MGEKLAGMEKLEALITEAKASGGSELANFQPFIIGLCEALGLDRPAMALEQNDLNDYVFERRVDFKHPDGSRTAGRIDCYRRGHFILEGKQSGKRQTTKISADQLALIPEDAAQFKPGQAKRGTRGWDQVMLAARKQAEDYARALPVEHGYPPFLLVVDVGHVIEVYADFSGQGKNYAHFPDRQSYRIDMDDLRDPKVQGRLRAIWTDPLSLDPTRISAEVTRDIAERLAKIAKRLEGKHDAKDVAEFLMRCLFTMFAEDVKLIPEKGFHKLLGQMKDTPEHFAAALESLWAVMDSGGYAPHLNATLKKFNGSLFKKQTALALDRDDINELWIAAGKDWSEVEPAIFGTLLERALDPRERSKLGAHYTPRAYVERLVVPTIIEPLRADWELVQGQVKELRDKGDNDGALAAVKAYHHKLCTTRVLDPACGTGNFLYVSLELMKRLEGEVLEALDNLGEDQGRFAMEGETVNPRQFYGLELNQRAVPIADLVLWIGYLKWQLKTGGLGSITEPVLHAYGTIKQKDAILTFDDQRLALDGQGKQITVWDGRSMKRHPVTDLLVPDESFREETYNYTNPKSASWPKVDFIIGNPPFIGNKRMRERLGDGAVDAIRAAYPEIPASVDIVMYWWAKAAKLLQAGEIFAFGFVTTNSIKQEYGRQTVDTYLKGTPPVHLRFAIPDHPWVDDAEAAQVRVSMTVAGTGRGEGQLLEVLQEHDIDDIDYKQSSGVVSSRLAIGVDLSSIAMLTSNDGLCTSGVTLVGKGFIVNSANVAVERAILKRYLNGKDVNGKSRNNLVVDTFGIGADELRSRYPQAYQWLAERVRPEREAKRGRNKDADDYADRWWQFAKPRPDLRTALPGLDSYFVSTQTSKHRLFTSVESDILPDIKLIAFLFSDFAKSAVLASRIHVGWSLPNSGRLGVGNDPVYSTRNCFNTFPFPIAVDPTLNSSDAHFAQQERLRELGKKLDIFRKERLAEHSFLTMTSIYNVLERFRELENGCDVPPLTDTERDVHQAGLVSVLKEIHDDIDRTVLTAYGWEDLIPELVGKPGATLPSTHKTALQEQAEEELLSRLVALNQERTAEEKKGIVRWLRPDYQIPKLGVKAPKAEGEHVGTLDIEMPVTSERPKWPSDGLEQFRLVRDLLSKAPAPTPPDALASVLDGKNTAKRRDRVTEVLETLVATGLARTGEYEGQRRYFLPR